MCKPPVTFKNRKYGLDISEIGFFGQKLNRGMMGREKRGQAKEQLVIESIPHCGSNMVEAVLWHEQLWLETEQVPCCLKMIYFLLPFSQKLQN